MILRMMHISGRFYYDRGVQSEDSEDDKRRTDRRRGTEKSPGPILAFANIFRQSHTSECSGSSD